MKTLESAKRAKELSEQIMKLHQDSAIRDESGKMIDVKWDKEKSADLFFSVYELRMVLDSIISTLNYL